MWVLKVIQFIDRCADSTEYRVDSRTIERDVCVDVAAADENRRSVEAT
jgi:hypothetical protein